MKQEDFLEINCKHGAGVASIICHHLLDTNEPMGFIENSSIPGDLQAWCYSCEELFLEEGEMTGKFKEFSDAKVVCEGCYGEAKRIHEIRWPEGLFSSQPPHVSYYPFS